MQLFKNVNVDWIGKKWQFIGASFLLFIASIVSLAIKGGPRYGIDFRGGTLVYVKFRNPPQLDLIRSALRQKGLGESTIQRYGPESDREVIISLEQKTTESGGELDFGRRTIVETLNLSFRPPEAQANKLDLNNVRTASSLEGLMAAQPGLAAALQKSGRPQLKSIQDLASSIIQYRTT